MYRTNPDGITWRVKQVLAKALGPKAVDEAVLLPAVSPDETRSRSLAYIDSLGDTPKAARMREVFTAYMDGRTLDEVMAATGGSRGTVSLELDGCHFRGGDLYYESGGPEGRSLFCRNTVFERAGLILANLGNHRRTRSTRSDKHEWNACEIFHIKTSGLSLVLLRSGVAGHGLRVLFLEQRKGLGLVQQREQPRRRDLRRGLYDFTRCAVFEVEREDGRITLDQLEDVGALVPADVQVRRRLACQRTNGHERRTLRMRELELPRRLAIGGDTQGITRGDWQARKRTYSYGRLFFRTAAATVVTPPLLCVSTLVNATAQTCRCDCWRSATTDCQPSAQTRTVRVSVAEAAGARTSWHALPGNEIDSVLFLDGQVELRKLPQKDLVESLLLDFERVPEMQRKLSRMWLAACELMSASCFPKDVQADNRPTDFLPFGTRLTAWEGEVKAER